MTATTSEHEIAYIASSYGIKMARHATRTVSSARFITPLLTQRKQETLRMLLDGFASSTNFCIQQCLSHRVTSRASLHHAAYTAWKQRYDLASHWFHSAGQVATQTLRSWRTRCRQGMVSPSSPPVYAAKTMRLERWDDENSTGVCRFHEKAIQIRVREGEHLWLPLIITEHHEHAYLQDWRAGKVIIGEVTVRRFRNRAEVYVPFKKAIEPKTARLSAQTQVSAGEAGRFASASTAEAYIEG